MERPLGFVPDVDTFSFHNPQNGELLQNANSNSMPELLFGNECEFGAEVCGNSPEVNHMPLHDKQ
jgi:hypothetical protein